MGTTGKRKGLWLAGIGVIGGLLAIGFYLFLPKERQLTDKARPVVHLDRTVDSSEEAKESGYWLSSNRLLIISTDHEGFDGGYGGWQGHADLFDLNTGSRMRLSGLSDLINKYGSPLWDAPFGFEPHGTWIYWVNNIAGGRGGFEPVVAMLDGSHFRKLEMDEPDMTFWLDNLHYVVIYKEEGSERNLNPKITELKVYDIENSKKDHNYPASSYQAKSSLKRYYEIAPTETSIESSDSDRSQIHIIIRRRDYEAVDEERTLHSYAFTLPDNRNLLQSFASPDQNRIVYYVRNEKPIHFMSWIHRLIPSIQERSIATEGLWVSRQDGQGLYELGHVPANTRANTPSGDQLEDVQWLPDGKQISFIYRGMLYVVPAEKRESP